MYKYFSYAACIFNNIISSIPDLCIDAWRQGDIEIFFLFRIADDNCGDDSKYFCKFKGNDDTFLYKIQLCDTGVCCIWFYDRAYVSNGIDVVFVL